MQTVQFISVTPEQLQNAIIEGVKQQLSELKKHFQLKAPDELMTRNEVSSYLKVDKSTIWAWTKSGKLISYGIRGRVYYKRSEIENAIIQLNK